MGRQQASSGHSLSGERRWRGKSGHGENPTVFARRALRTEPRPHVGMGIGVTFSQRAALAQVCGR
jgi:hypothetical protein